MSLTESFGRQYHEKGWEVVESVYEPDECERIAELSLKYVDHTPTTKDGIQEPRKVKLAYPCDVKFRRFAHDNRLLTLVRQLLDGMDPLLMMDQVFMKPPNFGTRKPFHQDNAYFQCEPADEIVTAWIALDDVDESNGCVRYIDGSHRGDVVDHHGVKGEEYNLTPEEKDIDRDRESKGLVKKGGVIFHHSKALHGSGPNTSDRWRRGYATHWVTKNVHSESAIYRRGFFHLPDYPNL